ncbi:uncharacterized protein LOC129960944 [Argiope bruennichi]|uniref:uncharacterized protein LOC129960944 n=1 Tax=Argiope bruennichi TaxID=94029 RepID=UPI0024957578|nr:uncharacterized protein LOC129960944 [Argiope bruennichi]
MIIKIVILLIACVIISKSIDVPIRCAHETACNCTKVSLECKCQSSEIIVLQSFAKYDWKRVLVQDCNFVKVSLGAFLHMNLEEVVFRNINKLKFRPFAFSGIKTMGRFRIENVNDLDVDLFGISGLYGLESVALINVTAPNLSEFAISGSNVTLFEIEGSSLILDSFSIVVWSMNDIYIRNTNIQTHTNSSLIIRTADRVHFQNSVFATLVDSSIVVLWTDLVEMLNCSFKTLPPAFLYGHTDHFKFNDNIIDNSETNAFQKFFISHTAEFKNNKFLEVEPDSIFPCPNNNVTEVIQKISIEGNKFHCDCRLAWLFTGREIYSPIIHSSMCHNYKQISLSQMFRFFYSNESCKFSGFDSTRMLEKMNRQLLKDDTVFSKSPSLYIGTFIKSFMINVFALCLMRATRTV